MLHILPHWNLEGHEGETIPVWVYSNCDEVSLSLSGKSLGRKKMEPFGYLEWKVPYKAGKITAKGYRNGKCILTETLATAGTPSTLSAVIDTEGDIAIVNVYLRDAQGRFVPNACLPVTLQAEGDVRILGGGNGDPAYHGPERPSPGSTAFTLPAFNGCVQFLLQGKGPVRLQLEGDGLQCITKICKFAN